MKKIAICIPSYNEAENIENITKNIDRGLKRIDKKYKCYIVNADNNSPDKTSEVFMKTMTKNEKIVLKCEEKGKGINIINFMKFCKKEDIDYAFTFDADLKSFKGIWISRMLKALIKNDFICPLYKRSRYEGNTTNHFVVPVIGIIYNRIIRQPIGGEYAFNKKYIDFFIGSYYNNYNVIKEYGIDVYLVLLALTNNYKIKEVKLGTKIHSPSYMKMGNIFENVAKSLEICIKTMPYNQCNHKNNWTYNSISKNKKSFFAKNILEKHQYLYEEEKEKWSYEVIQYLQCMKNNKEVYYQKMRETFIKYSYSYWLKYGNKTRYSCEKAIRQFYNNLLERYEKYECKNSL